MEAQTIDVTDIANKMQSSFVVWASSYVYGAACATPGFSWLGLPLLNLIFKSFLNWAFSLVSESAMMGAFFLATASRKATEAAEYVSAVNAKQILTETASDEDYEKAERAEIDSFNRFVCLTQ